MVTYLKSIKYLFVVLLLTQLTGCGINTIPTLDEQANADWAQVQNNYQRRADLIPNLVATVKGYAAHEKDTLTAVTEARSKVSSMQVTPETLNNPQAFKKFEAAQGQLSSALSRLMVVSERYPDLKANQQFIALQAQLEGTENRIAVARRDYINAVRAFNTEIRTFPGRLWHWAMYSDLKIKPNFTATTPNADVAPKVTF
ncbi:LemA family protein [Photobacterium phosphoreum]|uniref:LemA family protein n=1 Tax=Photobacterium phosphoreum TaxID=659 RepID=UPI000D16CBFE|nr:LemA family protein [Photobacterium phosphoreum]PSU62766.1 LemA family protein [Photobacterium phosphoreum]